jgi:hypothetical protein
MALAGDVPRARIRRRGSLVARSRASWGPVAALLLVAGGASCAPTAQPTAFTVHYATGSIPPPGNHAYDLTGTFDNDRIAVQYVLTYGYREMLAPGELSKLGYSDDDDITWDGTITGPAIEKWQNLLRAARLASAPPAVTGGDSFVVTIRYADGSEQTGVPPDRASWEALVTAIDQQARAETHNPRQRP